LVTYVRPTEATFQGQLDLVEAYADLREDREGEILAQLTPPVAFWSSVVSLHPDRTRYTLELLDVALRFANFVEMRLKQGLSCRRPIDYSPQVQPMILTPGHGSLPSGHSTEAFMIAFILWQLRRGVDNVNDGRWCEQLMRQASRVAINRTIAGVHFPVDSMAGQVLGLALGKYFVHRCTGVGTYGAWEFHGEEVLGTDDFNWRLSFDTAQLAADGVPAALPVFATRPSTPTAQQSHLLKWLWDLATPEWAFA
jgi:membrane-associated phospholipid phosphatase